MRRIKPSLGTSLWALLGHAPTMSPPRDSLAAVRQGMLDLLGEDAEQQHPTLFDRIRHAREAEALWYARHDLMVALAAGCGEAVARQRVSALNPLFSGLMPASLLGQPRPAA